MPSFTFVVSSVHDCAVIAFCAQTIWTHLWIIKLVVRIHAVRLQRYSSIPITLIRVEIRLNTVQHSALHLKEASSIRSSIRPDHQEDQPFLVLALANTRVPILDLLFNGIFVRIRVLNSQHKIKDPLVAMNKLTSQVTM